MTVSTRCLYVACMVLLSGRGYVRCDNTTHRTRKKADTWVPAFESQRRANERVARTVRPFISWGQLGSLRQFFLRVGGFTFTFIARVGVRAPFNHAYGVCGGCSNSIGIGVGQHIGTALDGAT